MVRIQHSEPQVEKAEVDPLAGRLSEHHRRRQEESSRHDLRRARHPPQRVITGMPGYGHTEAITGRSWDFF